MRAFLWIVVMGVGAIAACGSAGGGAPPAAQGCPAGQMYCSGCGSGGFCTSGGCPAFTCPAPADAGGSDAATSTASCPTGQTACADCSGGTLCLSTGCGAISCPSLDASANEGGGSQSDGPQPCHTNADCSGPFAYSCSPGGAVVGCGVAMRPPYPCNVDSDCQLIQDAAPPRPMVCGQPGGCVYGNSCVPACQSDSDCAGGDSVCRLGHCVAKPCSVNADCPSIGIYDFVCTSSMCTSKGCASDSDCHGGFCVNRTCSPQQGFCAPGAA
jgi:hypothetical protein